MIASPYSAETAHIHNPRDHKEMDRELHRILVILPCRNEQARVGPVVRSVRRILPHAQVLVINDESSDDTGAEAAEAGATVAPHAVNLGYGAALETGYLYALEHGFDVVAQMDGDGQHLPEELPTILRPIPDGQADVVIGSRFLSPDSDYPCSLVRKIGEKMLGGLVRLFTGLRLTDPTSGFQALNRSALLFLSSGVFPCDYPDADVITMTFKAGLRIREVPVRMLPRAGGKSMHSGLKPLYYMIKMAFSMILVLLNVMKWKKWREAHAARP